MLHSPALRLIGDPGPRPQPGDLNVYVKAIAIGKCLVDAHQIQARRVQMLILPLLIKQGGASPWRFVAVEA